MRRRSYSGTIVYSFQLGTSPEGIVQAFPLLALEQVSKAIAP
ncbi:hypothetical protein [Leptolyngbya sp. DQ-M1]